MSDPLPVATLRARVMLWIVNGADDAYLGTMSKDELQRRLREWIDRRFSNYSAIKELRMTCQQAMESVFNDLRSGTLDRAALLGNVELSENLNEEAEMLDGEQDKQTNEAVYLVQTLQVKHGVHWENLRPEPKTPADHMVVGALMALGQEDITMQTLIDLEDEKDEDRLRENRQRQGVISNLIRAMLQRQPGQQNGA